MAKGIMEYEDKEDAIRSIAESIIAFKITRQEIEEQMKQIGHDNWCEKCDNKKGVSE